MTTGEWILALTGTARALLGRAMLSCCAALALAGGAAAQEAAPFKWSGGGLNLELAPLAPDQVRAFFIGRGFASADAEFIAATACLFRSAIGHAGSDPADPPIVLRLADWRVVQGGDSRPPRLREDWESMWSLRKVDPEAAIAFHWALFPSEQEFRAADYNWGFLTFALPQGTAFDLEVNWRQGDATHRHRINQLECAK